MPTYRHSATSMSSMSPPVRTIPTWRVSETRAARCSTAALPHRHRWTSTKSWFPGSWGRTWRNSCAKWANTCSFSWANGDLSMIYLYLLGYSWLHIDSVQIHSYGHLYFLYSYFLGHTDLLEYMVWYVTNGCLRDILGIIMGSIGILREVSSISAPQIIQHMIGHVLRWKAQLLWGTIFLREKGRWSGMTLAQVGKGVTMKWAGNPSWERDDYFGGDDCTINEQMTMFHCRDLVVSTSPAKSLTWSRYV